MGKLFNRSTKKGKSVFDLSDDNAADSYGFIKEEQLPQNRSIRRRKMLTLALTVIFCAVLFGIIASVVYRITSGVLDNLDEKKRTVDVRPTAGRQHPRRISRQSASTRRHLPTSNRSTWASARRQERTAHALRKCPQ